MLEKWVGTGRLLGTRQECSSSSVTLSLLGAALCLLRGPGGGGRKEVLPCPHSPQAQDPAKMHIWPSASPLPSPRALGHHSLICPESPRLQLGSSWVPAGYWPISQESSGRACGFPSLCRAMGLSLVCIVQFLSIWLFWLCFGACGALQAPGPGLGGAAEGR